MSDQSQKLTGICYQRASKGRINSNSQTVNYKQLFEGVSLRQILTGSFGRNLKNISAVEPTNLKNYS
jgi:hypothetical protein